MSKKNKYIEENEPSLSLSEVSSSKMPETTVVGGGKVELPQAVELKDLALGYCKVKRGNETKWVVVSVALDGQTGQTSGIVDFLEELDTEADAVDRFKINVAERLMLINRR